MKLPIVNQEIEVSTNVPSTNQNTLVPKYGSLRNMGKPAIMQRDLILTHQDARAACPDYTSACGEEDPGSGLEFLVTKIDEHR